MTMALDPIGDRRVGTIGPDNREAWQASPHGIQERLGRIAVLHVGREDDQGPDQAEGIDEQVALAARAFFAAS